MYPEVSLKEAREKAYEARKLLSAGIDPSLSKKNPVAPADMDGGATFEALSHEWLERKGATWSEGHLNTVRYRLERFVFPHIGKLDPKAIEPGDVLSLIRLIENGGKNHTAHRVLGICSQVFKFGVASQNCASDPCRDLSDALTCYAETPRAALTKPSQAAQLMYRIRQYKSTIMRYALFWSAYTFCRPGEVRQAEWSEIDWEQSEWRIPAEKMKMRFEHRVPLASQCVAILEKLKEKNFPTNGYFHPRKEGGSHYQRREF